MTNNFGETYQFYDMRKGTFLDNLLQEREFMNLTIIGVLEDKAEPEDYAPMNLIVSDETKH